ncbi:amidohydrolase [Pseudonocardia acaciae]|uniref:amidohydrolase n=1 Tax=Pseudonocardia acaciae TaxID=551276 RepID=UPI00048C6168|nr:amidohydrolase [Pseudonocardia acaciae]
MASVLATADLVLRSGRIVTLDPASPNATAVAVRGERIVAVGSDEDVAPLIGTDTHVVDLAGRTVIPGINDAHVHLSAYALLQPPFTLDIRGVTSLDELTSALRAASPGPGAGDWLVGATWREGNIAELADGSLPPHRSQLDAATGDRPALLHHASLHGVWVNTEALRRAGIDRDTPDPHGGVIVRDEHGEPTGLLYDAAMSRVLAVVPQPDRPTRLDAIEAAMTSLNRLGVTSVTDPAVSPELLRDYTELHRQGRMSLRTSVLLHWGWPEPCSLSTMQSALWWSGAATGLGDDWLRIGGAKLFADGAPSHGTAWLYEPYPDGGHGSLTVVGEDDDARVAELAAVVDLAHRNGLDLQIHVTGDRTADAAIDALIAAQKATPRPTARHALIHGTLLTDEALARLAEHDIAVVTNSLLKATAASGMTPMIGEHRWARTFPAGSMLAAGVRVVDSSDAPCTVPDWRGGVATFVGAVPAARVADKELVTTLQALHMWTTAPAHLEGAESSKGALAPGYLADLAVLGADPLSTPHDRLTDIPVEMTIVGGKTVFDNEEGYS